MKLEFKEVWFRNFLSYGSSWNHIKFEPNINLIIGDLDENMRSNAIGKSSALMSISFALFGKIQKNVVKNDIVNWQNKKKCEVQLLFYRRDDKILIKRGLKPNYLEIYINDEPVPQESDLRVAQSKLESEIIGWNLDMFNNLIYCNPNNTISILDTNASKKRQFLENLFSDIEYFSSLMDETTKKLKSIKRNISDNEIKIKFHEKNILDLQKEIENLENSGSLKIEKNFKEYRELQDEYNKLYEEFSGLEQEVENHENELKQKKEEITQKENEQKDIKNEIYRLKSVDLKNQQDNLEQAKKNDEYSNELQKINEYLKSTDGAEEDKKKLSSEISDIDKQIKDLEQEKHKHEANLETLEEQKNSLRPDYSLKNKSTCPKCGNEIDYEKVKEHFKTERDEIKGKISELKKKIESVNTSISEVEESKKETNDNFEEVKNTCETRKSYKDKKEYLENFINSTKSKSTIKEEIKRTEEEISQFEEKEKKISDRIGILLFERDDIEFKLKTYKNNLEKLNNTKSKLDYAEMVYNHAKESMQETKNLISDKKKKLKSTEKEKTDLSNKNKKLNDLQDYFEYLKDSLKDENIKSYVINTIIPYLNQKVNDYLSVAGFDFYVVFDNWMNVTINGPGNRADCKFGSMSGGESKTIDLVTKFALMDIAKMRAKIHPDILILDEILDSSIDDFGIEKLLEIIRYKQEQDNIKIFIISHRKEINDMISGKMYKIKKKDNFSYIKEL